MAAVEFFTTFRFTATTDLDRPNISFRLFGLEFEMSLTEWAVRMGVATSSEVEMPYWRKVERGIPGKHITFDGNKKWRKVARAGAVEFNTNKSLGADIKDPVLCLAQILLGFNLLGQDTCFTRVSLTELYFMRRMQEGRHVNLAFWLAYQAHQINRSKTRHLNLCHIVGVFIKNNINLLQAREGLRMELCMSHRLFNIDLLIEHQIVRVLEGDHAFYEPSHVTLKPRKSANVLQGHKRSQAKGTDEADLIWVVDELHSQRSQVDAIHVMVKDVWKVIMKMKEEHGIVVEDDQEISEEERQDDEGDDEEDQADDQEEELEEREEADDEEKKKEEENARLVRLAVQAVNIIKNQEAQEKPAPPKKKSAPQKKPEPKKRSRPSQGSPSGSAPRSKRGR